MDKKLKNLIIFTLLCYTFTLVFHDNMTFFAHASDGETTVNLVSDLDGSIGYNNALGTYTNYTANNDVLAASYATGNKDRGYFRFNLNSSIPQNAIITKASFKYHGHARAADCKLVNMTTDPRGNAANAVFWDIGNSTTLYDVAGLPVEGTDKEITLGEEDVFTQNLTRALNNGKQWFSLGFMFKNEAATQASASGIYSTDYGSADPEPTLCIEYYVNPYTYTFTDTFYENGTKAVSPYNVSVTVSGEGYTDEFNTTDGSIHYYDPEPVLISWAISGGASRKIYSIGSENITVTRPEATFAVYSFTVKDYVGFIGDNTGYVEAYRTINGTETLIERMKITQPNPSPLNLVVGVTYHIKILANNTRFDWGYFVATSDTTHTILLKEIDWSSQAQILYNTITVDATRSGSTITVDYEDERSHTVWANVSIRERGGPVVFTAARNNDTYQMNWASASTDLGYVVTITGEHSDYGEWGRSFILDYTGTYPDAPSFDGIFGNSLGNLFAWLITIAAMLTFSLKWKGPGLLAGMFLASMFSLFGWADWTSSQLFFGWFVAIGATINHMQNGGQN